MTLYLFVVYIDILEHPCPPPHHPEICLLIPCWRDKTWHLANKKKKNILDLKHIKIMPSLVPQVTQIIFNSPFSMKDFHTNHNQLNWFGYDILQFVPIELKINLLCTKS